MQHEIQTVGELVEKLKEFPKESLVLGNFIWNGQGKPFITDIKFTPGTSGSPPQIYLR